MDSSQPGTGVSTSGADSTPASLGYTADPNQAGIDSAAKASGQASGYLDANGNPTSAPTQDSSYQDTLKGFQSEIDGLNTAAAQAKSDITTQNNQVNQKALASNRALQARSGELGGSFGQGQTANIEQTGANKNISDLTAQDAKDQQAMAALDDKIRTQADTDYQNKLTAYKGGADSTLTYLQGKSKTAQTNADQFATTALSQGVDLSDPKNQAQLNAYAKQIGVSPDVLLNSYNTAKTTAAATKAAADKATADLASVYATIAKDQGETLTPEEAQAKAAADLAATKANTAQSYASATQSLAAAAKTKAETAQLNGNPNNANKPGYDAKGNKYTNSSAQDEILNDPQAGWKTTNKWGSDGFVSPQTYNQGLSWWVGQGLSAPDYKGMFGGYINPKIVKQYNS